jgi:PAS domain S-box-containing protein
MNGEGTGYQPMPGSGSSGVRVGAGPALDPAILDALDLAIALFGPDDRLAHWNRSFAGIVDPQGQFLEAGTEIGALAAQNPQLAPLLNGGAEHGRFRTPTDCIYTVRRQPLPEAGWVLSLRDVTEQDRIEQAFRDSRAQLEGFFAHIPAIATIKDADCRFRLISHAGEEAFGRGLDEIIGRRTDEIDPSEAAEHIVALERQVLTSGASAEGEVYWPQRRRFNWTYEVKFPIRDAAGVIVAIGGAAIDISQLKRAEQALRNSERRLARAQRIAHMAHWVWIGRRGGQWDEGSAEYSESAEAIFGVPPAEIVCSLEDYVQRFVHPDDRTRARTAFINNEERRARGLPFEYRIVRPDGSVRTLAEVSEIVFDQPGFPQEVIGTIIDVTERKRFEQDLIDAKLKAEQANHSKSQFLANMSHELRTPLNAVIGFAEVIAAELFGKLEPDRYKECAEDIRMSSRHLLALLEEILDTSRIEVNQYKLREESCSVREIAQTALTMVRPDAEKKRIHLGLTVSDELPRVFVDPKAMRQALINLLGNAIKFTAEHGRIDISVDWEGGDSALRIAVTDTGIGIAPEHLERIFERFAQVENTYARRHGGVGLGLHITRRLVELHGGSIAVWSAPGEGSRFELQLPASRMRG